MTFGRRGSRGRVGRCTCARPAVVCACCGGRVPARRSKTGRTGFWANLDLTPEEAASLRAKAERLTQVDPAVQAERDARRARVAAARERLTRSAEGLW